jgi:hypothetical protein
MKYADGQPVFIKGDYRTPYRIMQHSWDSNRKDWDCELQDRAGNVIWEYERYLTPMVLYSKIIKKACIRSVA